MQKSKNNNSGVAFKFYLEKPFDNVNWDFLKDHIFEFGLTPSTIKLIMSYVTLTSRMVTRRPTHSYLFILRMENLSIFICEAASNRN